MAKREYPSFEELNELLSYNPETGDFFWKRDVGKNIKKGDRCGKPIPCHYSQIGIKGKVYYSHRLAWVLTYKEQPPQYIDHINGDKNDNRIANLRKATNSQNMTNRGKNKTTESGLKGAYYHKKTGKYFSSICKDYKTIYLGIFDTKEEAHAAYCEAAKKLHGDFANIES